MSKIKNLQQALNNTAGVAKPEKHPAAVIVPNATEKAPMTKKSPSREGKENLSVWLHPDFKKSLRLAQLRKTGKVYLDDLMAEALNDLFRKYDVPTVTHE